MSHQRENWFISSRVGELDEFLSGIADGDFIDELLELARSVGTSRDIDSHGNFVIDVPVRDTLVIGATRHPRDVSLSLSKSSPDEYPLAVEVIRRHVRSRDNVEVLQEMYFEDTNTSQIALSKP